MSLRCHNLRRIHSHAFIGGFKEDLIGHFPHFLYSINQAPALSFLGYTAIASRTFSQLIRPQPPTRLQYPRFPRPRSFHYSRILVFPPILQRATLTHPDAADTPPASELKQHKRSTPRPPNYPPRTSVPSSYYK